MCFAPQASLIVIQRKINRHSRPPKSRTWYYWPYVEIQPMLGPDRGGSGTTRHLDQYREGCITICQHALLRQDELLRRLGTEQIPRKVLGSRLPQFRPVD